MLLPEAPPAADSGERIVAAAGDFDGLARRIARRTTDLIAIALMLIAGLTVTRRVLDWQRTSPQELQADPEFVYSRDALAPWGIGPGGVAIRLGEQPLTLHREALRGSREDALGRLRSTCRESLAAASSRALAALPPPAATEQRLLSQLQTRRPAESDPGGGWELHELSGPLAMVLGVRRGAPPDDGGRVLCWGLVLPIDGETWTILRVMPRGIGAEASPAADWPLPVDCLRGLGLSDPLGGSLITFTGTGPPEVWRTHFEQLADTGGWSRITAWRCEPAAWSVAWRIDASGASQRLDLQFNRLETGWSGLIHLAPIRRPNDTQEQP